MYHVGDPQEGDRDLVLRREISAQHKLLTCRRRDLVVGCDDDVPKKRVEYFIFEQVVNEDGFSG